MDNGGGEGGRRAGAEADNGSLRILSRIRAVTAPWRIFEATPPTPAVRRFYSRILARDFSNPRWTE